VGSLWSLIDAIVENSNSHFQLEVNSENVSI
jgi:hypothetical protein